MTEEKIRQNISSNIASYRKQMGWTQTELSERINYSDKSVSKWERGEGVPDVYVLVRLSELFGLSLSDMTADKPARVRAGGARQKTLIILMSIGLTWLVAAIVFCILEWSAPRLSRTWLAFIYAIPVSSIVAIVFTVKWHHLWLQLLSVTVLVWGLAASFDLSFCMRSNMTIVYIIAAVMQVLVILWYTLMLLRRRPTQSPPVVLPSQTEPSDGENARSQD